MTDVTQLSDADLMAIINGQPPATNQPPQQPPQTAAPPHATSQDTQPLYIPGHDPGATIGTGPQQVRMNEAQAHTARQLQGQNFFNYNEPEGGPHNFYGVDPKNPVYPQGPGAWFLDLDGKLKQNPEIGGPINGAIGAAARGVPVAGAFADEGSAAVNATLAPLIEPLMRRFPGHDTRYDLTHPETAGLGGTGGNGTWSSRYQAAENLQRGMAESFDVSHPGSSVIARGTGMAGGALAGGELLSPVSSFALPEGAGLLPRILAGSADGGMMGGLQGYGSGYGGWTDPSRVHGAMNGGIVGAGLGGGFPLASSLGGAAATRANMLADALTRRRVTIGASPEVSLAARGVPQGVQTGPNALNDLTDAIMAIQAVPPASVSPTTARNVYGRVAAAIGRQGQAPADAIAQANQLGIFGQLADTGEATRDLARAAVDGPGPAGQIARNALDLRQMGVKADGVYSVRPASTRIGDNLAAGMGVGGQGYNAQMDAILAARKAAAGPAYASAYSAPPVPTSTFGDFAQSPNFQAAYDRARRLSQSEFVPQRTPANDTFGSPANDGDYLPQRVGDQIQALPAQVPPTLDWRTLDLMKQGLDDMVREGRSAGIGANEQRAVAGFNTRFVQKLDSLNPAYGAARDAFAGPSRMLDALDAGRSYMSEDAPVLANAMGGYGDGEQQMFRLGAVQANRDRLGNVPTTRDAATLAGANTPNQLNKLQQLFPSQQAYGDYANMLDANKTMFDTRARVLGGSQTSRNLAQADEGNPLEDAGHLAAALHGDHGSLGHLLGRVWSAGNGEAMDEATREGVATALLSMNRGAMPGLQEGIEAATRRMVLSDALRRYGQPAAVQVGLDASAPDSQGTRWRSILPALVQMQRGSGVNLALSQQPGSGQ